VTFTFGTLCSGIEAASEAFLPLGAECLYVSEIEPFPCGVLAERHGAGKPIRMPNPDQAPDEKSKRARRAAIKTVERFPRWGSRIPNYGDLTQIAPEELPAVDLLVAGFPCQDFSIAGLRHSLAGSRGNLTLFGIGLIHELARMGRIRSFLYENVPDLLNTKDNAFGAFLGGVVGHDAPIVSPVRGGRWTNAGVADGPLGTAAWRVEDAQYSHVAQRRERLFLVASFGDGPDPVEVLLERQGLSRNPPARGEAGEGTARPADERAAGGGVREAPQRRSAFGGNNTSGPIEVATARTASHTASGRQDFETETFVVEPVGHIERGHSDYGPGLPILRASGGDAGNGSEMLVSPVGGDQGGDYVVQPVAFSLRGRAGGAMPEVEEGGVAPALRAAEGGSTRPFVAFQGRGSNIDLGQDVTGTLSLNCDRASGGAPSVATDMAVRRITVVEACRLQGFSDFYTLIEWSTANRKGQELAEQVAYLIGHGFSPADAECLAQTPDGPQYKALGNSKAVPHVRKIGIAFAAALKRYLATKAAS
jgi:DNA (cytosine-5)-methyltransferase 1